MLPLLLQISNGFNTKQIAFYYLIPTVILNTSLLTNTTVLK